VTNIPDAKTKQHLGALNGGAERYLISNPRNNTELIRQPLTIAMSRGADLSYKHVGVLRTNASDDIAPDTRGEPANLVRQHKCHAEINKITRTKDSHTLLRSRLGIHLLPPTVRTSRIFGSLLWRLKICQEPEKKKFLKKGEEWT
jgi:hypothetical protein